MTAQGSRRDAPVVLGGTEEPAVLGDEREGDERPEREELFAHHHEASEPLVLERREPPEPIRLLGVAPVERPHGEDEDVGEDLPGGEQRNCESELPREAQLAASSGVDELDPHQHPDDDEQEVFHVVNELMRERVVIGRGHVPGRDDGRPEQERDLRFKQEAETRSQPAQPREPAEHRRRDQEEGQRPSERYDCERHGKVSDDHVLEHVHGEQVLLADVVERRDQRQRPERHGEREERNTVPARMVLATAPSKPDERLPEQRQRERRACENGDRRLPGGGDCLVMAGVREDQGAASTWPSTQSPVKVYPTIRSMSGTCAITARRAFTCTPSETRWASNTATTWPQTIRATWMYQTSEPGTPVHGVASGTHSRPKGSATAAHVNWLA